MPSYDDLFHVCSRRRPRTPHTLTAASVLIRTQLTPSTAHRSATLAMQSGPGASSVEPDPGESFELFNWGAP